MSSKRPSMSPAGTEKKKRKAITLEQKLKIINEHKAGKAVTIIAREHQLSQSTISTILKDKKRIMEAIKSSASVHSTIITRKRTGPLQEMEQLLVVWMEDQIQKRIPLNLLRIQAKARTLFDDLKKRYDDPTYNQEFTASYGWFQRLKNRHNFHSVNVSSEAASADAEAAEKFKEELHRIILEENYLPEQIFNVDETGLYWKRMTERTCIHKEAKMMTELKAFKDRLTLLLGGNVAGYKLKPFMIDHSVNLRALARMSKNMLPIYYRHNKRAWMTPLLFEDWFVNCFIPEVKEYCRENNIPFKIILILDNTPSHHQYIGDAEPSVRVVFLPPNTASLIQPIDQGAVAMFKAYYLRNMFTQAVEATKEKELCMFWKEFNILNAIKNVVRAWDEVTKECLNGIWNNLLNEHSTFQGFDKDDAVGEIYKKIVSLGRSLELEVKEDDIQELIDARGEEVTLEELIELAEERKREEEEIEEEPEKTFNTKKMSVAFSLIDKGLKLLKDMDVSYERFTTAERQVQDALACYKLIYEERKRRTVQSTVDILLQKTSASPSPSSTLRPQPSTSRDDSFIISALIAEEERFDELSTLSSPSSSSDN